MTRQSLTSTNSHKRNTQNDLTIWWDGSTGFGYDQSGQNSLMEIGDVKPLESDVNSCESTFQRIQLVSQAQKWIQLVSHGLENGGRKRLI